MNASSDVLSGSQSLIRAIVAAVFLLSLFSLFLYVTGSLGGFTEENLMLLLSVASFSSAAVLVSVGLQALIVLFALMSQKKVFWKYFFADIAFASLSAGVLYLVSLVRVLQAGLSF